MVAIAVRLVGPEMLFCSQQGCEKDVGIVLVLLHEDGNGGIRRAAADADEGGEGMRCLEGVCGAWEGG